MVLEVFGTVYKKSNNPHKEPPEGTIKNCKMFLINRLSARIYGLNKYFVFFTIVAQCHSQGIVHDEI